MKKKLGRNMRSDTRTPSMMRWGWSDSHDGPIAMMGEESQTPVFPSQAVEETTQRQCARWRPLCARLGTDHWRTDPRDRKEQEQGGGREEEAKKTAE